jgi:hypothetical protein
MVDRAALVTDLESFGDVEFCDQNSDISYLVVMLNWTENEDTFKTIADIYITPDFPYLYTISLVDGVLKAQYNSENV